tara:strand:+ start:622 stop:753 length:132 start_codon:yes stop_codon:yes gene_type:complete
MKARKKPKKKKDTSIYIITEFIIFIGVALFAILYGWIKPTVFD